jgi:excisionase family DNA binding protein
MDWMTVAAAAQYLAVHKKYIYTACEAGLLRHVRLGGKRRIRLKREWLDAFMDTHTTAPQQ